METRTDIIKVMRQILEWGTFTHKTKRTERKTHPQTGNLHAAPVGTLRLSPAD
jgi:hypothetical protein